MAPKSNRGEDTLKFEKLMLLILALCLLTAVGLQVFRIF